MSDRVAVPEMAEAAMEAFWDCRAECTVVLMATF